MPGIVVTGSRDFPTNLASRHLVKLSLLTGAQLLRETRTLSPHRLLHGGARGLDTIAGEVAGEMDWSVEVMKAQWGTHTPACPDWHWKLDKCKMAGHRRNAEMLATKPDLVIGFPMHPQDSSGSRGTWGCIAAAQRLGLPVAVLHEKQLWLDTHTANNQPDGWRGVITPRDRKIGDFR